MGGLAHHTESSSPGAEIWAASRAPRTTPPNQKGGCVDRRPGHRWCSTVALSPPESLGAQ